MSKGSSNTSSNSSSTGTSSATTASSDSNNDSGSGNQLLFTIATFIAGAVFGIALGLFLAYVALPAQVVLREAPPLFLRVDPSGATVEYQNLYIARVAGRYSQGVQGGTEQPAFAEAQNSLGITSGDASPEEALSMATLAQAAAEQENLRDGPNPDAGYFTLADQNNMKLLADRLIPIQGQPVVVPETVAAARRNALIFGLIGLTLLGAFLVGALVVLNGMIGPSKSVTATTTKTTTSTYTAPATDDAVQAKQMPPASAEEVQDLHIDAKLPPPPQSGARIAPSTVAAMAGAVTLQQRVASPVAGEMLIGTFTSSYSHGERKYEEGFQISSSSGDLIGECGAMIAERYGAEDAPPVIALATWVFDKSDFHSTKRVLMTPFAFRDPIIKDKLKSLGEPVQARLGMFEVQTTSLRVEVEVRNLLMKPIDNDPDGYFEQVDLEFRVFKTPV